MGIARQPVRRFLGGFLLVAAGACAAAALAAQFGLASAACDLLAQFAHFWLALGALALAGAVLVPRGRLRIAIAGLAAVAILAAGALIAPELLRPAPPTAPAGAPDLLKVVQLNAWELNADPAGTVSWLIAQHPDIVALEEASPALRRQIAARTSWHSACPRCEVLILSRRPPASARLVWHSGHQVMTLTQATFRDGRGPYSVVAVHWPRPTRPAFQHQQLRWLALALAVEPRARTILVGDFNTTPWSPRWRAWERASGLIRRDRALFSWPAGHAFGVRRLPPVPLLPIDHVYAGAGWATVSVRRGPELGSDHYPLVMTLAPRQRWNAPIAVRTKRENNTTVTRAR